jgi:lactate racemase
LVVAGVDPVSSPAASIRWSAWFEDTELALDFPRGWSVRTCAPPPAPDIGADGVAAAFANPIGTRPLHELARGRPSACIVIDDLSRPTQGARLIPPVLQELERVGIPLAQRESIVLRDSWPATRDWLQAKHGERAEVAVFPRGTTQLMGTADASARG